jgi:hypothetical protein
VLGRENLSHQLCVFFRGLCRQRDLKHSAALARAHAASKAYLAMVMVNDFSRKRKPDAGTSIFFCREKRLENLSDEFAGYSMTVVCDYKMYLVSTFSQSEPKRALKRQGIESVRNEV